MPNRHWSLPPGSEVHITIYPFYHIWSSQVKGILCLPAIPPRHRPTNEHERAQETADVEDPALLGRTEDPAFLRRKRR